MKQELALEVKSREGSMVRTKKMERKVGFLNEDKEILQKEYDELETSTKSLKKTLQWERARRLQDIHHIDHQEDREQVAEEREKEARVGERTAVERLVGVLEEVGILKRAGMAQKEIIQVFCWWLVVIECVNDGRPRPQSWEIFRGRWWS